MVIVEDRNSGDRLYINTGIVPEEYQLPEKYYLIKKDRNTPS